MNYELARELKDAGFSQEGYPRGNMVVDDVVCEQCNDNHHAYAPTLEELIEACGEYFYTIFKIRGRWFAKTSSEIEIEGKRFTSFTEEKGSTPTEAVAMLYLALYGKKQGNKDAGETSRMEGK